MPTAANVDIFLMHRIYLLKTFVFSFNVQAQYTGYKEIFMVLHKIGKISDFDHTFNNLIWKRCILIYKIFFIIVLWH